MPENFSIIDDVLYGVKKYSIDNNPPGYVYVISLNEFYKIGMSCEPLNRISSIQTSVPYKINIELIIPSRDMNILEKELHKKFKDKRVSGEWFLLNEEDIKEIRILVPPDFVYSVRKNTKISELEFFGTTKRYKKTKLMDECRRIIVKAEED